jgi:nuclear pore complex protein Nup62
MATATAAPKAAPSLLAGLRLEEIVNRWNAELEERVKEYEELAAEVRAWDQVLIANGEKVRRLSAPHTPTLSGRE